MLTQMELAAGQACCIGYCRPECGEGLIAAGRQYLDLAFI
jgi:hypothetical protein